MRRVTDTDEDTAYVNGTIFTADPARVWAHAFGVRGNRIVAVGTDDEVLKALDSHASVHDLNATLVVPGFIDGHFHLLMTGEAQLRA
ncbi:MAG: amidohydrolase, partial [Candidatus Nanopelagicales bacterium]